MRMAPKAEGYGEAMAGFAGVGRKKHPPTCRSGVLSTLAQPSSPRRHDEDEAVRLGHRGTF